MYYMQQIDTSYGNLINNHMEAINKMADISVAFQRTRVNIRDMLLTQPQKEATEHGHNQSTVGSNRREISPV